MDELEAQEKFDEDLKYIQKHIPPDDIYSFAEYSFLAALFFFQKFSEHVDIEEEMSKDPLVDRWGKNILYFQYCKQNNIDITLEMGMKEYGSE